ncbi:hypothetical protein [Knoellia aerolata]|uniref:hypothetical protein n=1 Tax=Knoellia aerolata TaxID=442954 RepID=UPI0012EE0B44|nr:hypothetical protein [Knoellia aerolata]
MRLHHRFDRRYWLVLQQGQAYGCLTDPLLDGSRYVYLDSSLPALLAIARGRRSWSEAFDDGSVRGSGNPDLLRRVPPWFVPAASTARSVRAARGSVDLSGAWPP